MLCLNWVCAGTFTDHEWVFPLENVDEVSLSAVLIDPLERALQEQGEKNTWRESGGCGTVLSMT